MMNIITSEFYKIFKSKVFYGIIAALLAINLIFFINVAAIRYSSSYTAEQKVAMEVPGIMSYQGSLDADVTFYIVLIFIACLITAEYTNGSIRQMTCHGFARWKLVLGQYIPMSLVASALIVMFALINTIFPTILYGFGTVDTMAFLRMNMGLLCIIWGISGIGTFLSYLIRSGAGTIGTCIMLIMGSNLGIQLIAYITKNEEIIKYSLGNMRSIALDLESTPRDVGFYSMIFLAIGIVTILGSCLLFSKRDVD
jgi:ABC-2 type transport system permease protein